MRSESEITRWRCGQGVGEKVRTYQTGFSPRNTLVDAAPLGAGDVYELAKNWSPFDGLPSPQSHSSAVSLPSADPSVFSQRGLHNCANKNADEGGTRCSHPPVSPSSYASAAYHLEQPPTGRRFRRTLFPVTDLAYSRIINRVEG